MGLASSSSRLLPQYDGGPCDAAAVAERQRFFEFFEKIDPGRTFRWNQHAYFMYKCSGDGGVDRARAVHRAAVNRCGADYGIIYSAWITMEIEVSADDQIYEEWRARTEADDGDGRAAAARLMWADYVQFEEQFGGAALARAVAEAAVAACPRDAEVRAVCVLSEVRLGDDGRAREAFDRALADFAGDEEVTARFTEEVRRGGAFLSYKWYGGGGDGCLLHLLCRGWSWFRPPHWWEQI